jgi:hypothetical protein
MLSLGISHKPPLKSAMRNSVRDSDISNLANGMKLDLTKFKPNPEDYGAGRQTSQKKRLLPESKR